MPPWIKARDLAKIMDSWWDPWTNRRVQLLLEGHDCIVYVGKGRRVYGSTDRIRENLPDIYSAMLRDLEERALKRNRG